MLQLCQNKKPPDIKFKYDKSSQSHSSFFLEPNLSFGGACLEKPSLLQVCLSFARRKLTRKDITDYAPTNNIVGGK